MDQFQRATSSSGQYGPQAPQHNASSSQSGGFFGQGQTTHGGGSYAAGSAAQTGSSFAQNQGFQSSQGFSQGQGAQGQSSYSQAQTQPQGQSDARQSFGGQGPQNVIVGANNTDARLPSISRRRYIKWGMVANHRDTEDTETIVLTEPETGLFVDVRLLKAHLHDVGSGNHVQLEPEQIDWAFAGDTVSTPLQDQAYHRFVKFNHWIDSRTLKPEDVVDKAYMYYPNDGTSDEIEVGSMTNPHTGDKQGYEERWSDEDVVPAAGQQSRLCIVLTTEQSDGTRGTVIVLGQWAQGVMRTGQKTLHIERWYSDSRSSPAPSQFGAVPTTPSVYPSPQPSHAALADDKNEGWQLVARVGVPILPSPASFVNKDLDPNTICSVNGMQWTVRAVRRW